MIKTDKEYNKMVEILNKYNKHYYDLDEPITSDEEYDKLYKIIKEYENLNPDKINKNSPTKQIGGNLLEHFTKQKHIKKMWSLNNVFNKEDLNGWLSCIKNKINKNLEFCVSPKYDGMSLNLLYKDGKLQNAITRGDGSVGEVVTQNALNIKNIPTTIPYIGTIEIRGEVLISKDNFNKLNKQRENNKETLFANPRNAASGSMRQLNSNLILERNLEFVVWGFGHYDNIQDLEKFINKKHLQYYNILKIIESFGFTKLSYLKVVKENNIQEEYLKILDARNDFKYMLDGFVIMLNNLSYQDVLGYSLKYPKFACAYKFPSLEKVIQINSISLQVGRTGMITPVANFTPTLLEGVYISKATLHNYKEIETKDIRIKDYCLLVRSGGVIPKITKVLKDRRTDEQTIITKPINCPICNNKLFYDDINIYCKNKECSSIIKSKFINFVSRKCMNISGLGESLISILVDNKLIKEFIDLYNLTENDLLKLEGIKKKKAENVINSINNSIGKIELHRFINSLGIPNIGEEASKKLAKYGEKVFEYNVENLIDIGLGKDSAISFYNYCKNNKSIYKLLNLVKPII